MFAPLTFRSSIVASLCVLAFFKCTVACANDAKFLFGVNLNGPSVVIDGNPWEGQESLRYECNDKAFENQEVKLIPPTDAARAKMIRSSRWGGNRLQLKSDEQGVHTVYLYVWEDNNSETYDVIVNGQTLVRGHRSGKAGKWDRLGPWYIEPQDGKLLVESRGGAANFSGVEVWLGKHDGAVKVEASPEELAFFEQRIRPVLVERCYECHASDSAEIEGELLVDSAYALRRGGSNGPALIVGDAENSLLVKAIRYRDSNLQMPPDGRLSDAEIADIERWINYGAADPRSEVTRFQRKSMDISEAKKYWAFQPLQRPEVPSVQRSDWPTSPIDYFVLAKMEERSFSPAPDADRRTWIRRATFDLIGLPPTPEEVKEFVEDTSSEAYEKVIDRLLDSPRYGERWGRYWLDVVRYADTAGDNSDFPIPQMHLYRDWVIESFNKDVPYDRFVAAQLAGDLLPTDSQEERRRNIIATGYIANARRFGSRVDDYPQHLTIEDTLDNFGRAFLGLSINCARCHDHKFDPISMEDYYGLYGIFDSTRYPWPGIELEQRQRDLVALASDEEIKSFETSKANKQRELDAEVKRLETLAKNASGDEKTELENKIKAAREAAVKNSQIVPPYELIYGVADKVQPNDAAIQLKGDPAKPGDIAPRKFLAVLGNQTLAEPSQSSGRLQLVQWLFAPTNPLAARVMVNRLWQYHFGKGLVPTPNDYGKQGKPPTHPELLDWLATKFIEDGWSLKAMHRQMMLSRTYRLSSRTAVHDAGDAVQTAMLTQAESDPNNDWLSAFDRRRIDAESLRDTMLLLGGNLDLTPPGEHPFPPQTEWKFTQHNPFKAEYPSNHRSVYLMTQRIQRHSFLAIFDGADPSVSVARRSPTTTPLQSLFLLNDPLVHELSEKFVTRLLKQSGGDDAAAIRLLFELSLSRPASSEEQQQSAEYLAAVKADAISRGASESDARRESWQSLVRVVFRLNEFVYID